MNGCEQIFQTVDPMNAQNYSNIVFGNCNCYTMMHINYVLHSFDGTKFKIFPRIKQNKVVF